MARRHRLFARAAGLYWRLRKPRTLGVRAIVLDRQDRIALVRHTYTDAWYLPGGGVKKGERFDTALLRELREEIRILDPEIERMLGLYHSLLQSKDDHIVIFVVRAQGDSGTVPAIGDPLEIAETGWFAPDDLPASLSPATRRRIEEYRTGTFGLGDW